MRRRSHRLGSVYAAIAAGDPFIADVKLILNFGGTNGSTAFADDSANGVTITPGGTVAMDGANGATFDGASGSVLDASGSSLNVSGYSWTYEGFYTLTSVSSGTQMFISGFSASVELGQDPTGLPFSQPDNFHTYTAPASQCMYSGTRHHVATTFDSGTNDLALFVDGVRVSHVTSGNMAGNTLLRFGARKGGTSYRFAGTMGPQRITKAVRYTGTSFTPPAFGPFPTT